MKGKKWTQPEYLIPKNGKYEITQIEGPKNKSGHFSANVWIDNRAGLKAGNPVIFQKFF